MAHEVLSYKQTGKLLTGIVRSKSSDELYECSIDSYGEWSCTCKYGFYGKEMCSHITDLIEEVKPPEKFIKDEKDYNKGGKNNMEPIGYIETDMKGINRLLGGGIPDSEPIAIYGRWTSGKTILTTQLVTDVSDGNILIINTEGDKYPYLEWVKRFNERFGKNYSVKFVGCKWKGKNTLSLDYEKPDGPTIFVADIRYIDQILAFHGRGAIITISEPTKKSVGGKMEIVPNAYTWRFDVEYSKIFKFIKENDIKALAYDSITTPLEEFGGARQNFYIRHICTRWWLLQANKISQTYNIPIVATLQETKDPANKYDHPDFTGGKSIGHTFKYTLRIRTKAKNIKVIAPERHPYLDPKSLDHLSVKLTNNGFVEV